MPDLYQREMASSDERHRRVDDGGDHGTRGDGDHRREGHRESGEHAHDQHGPERRVHRQQAPRVLVEVAQREPHRLARLHPLIPAAVTPEMKKRWKTRKMIRIGAIAMRLPAMSWG